MSWQEGAGWAGMRQMRRIRARALGRCRIFLIFVPFHRGICFPIESCTVLLALERFSEGNSRFHHRGHLQSGDASALSIDGIHSRS